MKKISAIILSAGLGTRSKAVKPLLLWKEKETFLAKVYKSLLESKSFDEILIVTGSHREDVEREAKLLKANTVFNSQFSKGMHSSIKVGLKALKPGWSGALIALVDQPQIDSRDYKSLVLAYEQDNVSLVRPGFRGQFGNPVIVAKDYLSEIESEPDADYGCNYLFKRHPQDALVLEMPTARCLMDFDIPVDFIS